MMLDRYSAWIAAGALTGALVLSAGQSRSAEMATVRVNAFPNAKALSLHVGLAKGIFAKHGLALELQFTENSRNQRDGLAEGKFEIAQAALDNAVAMIEVGKHD